MIICKLTDVINSDYFDKESVQAIQEFIQTHDLKTLPLGAYPLNGENRVVISQYQTKENDFLCESHRRYADVQCIIDGEELLKLAYMQDCEITAPYDAEKDLELYKGDGKETAILKGGDVDSVIFYPEEIHQPGLCVTKPAPVKKAVFKIVTDKRA